MPYSQPPPSPGASCARASTTPPDPPDSGSSGTGGRRWRCGARCSPRSPRRSRRASRRPSPSAAASSAPGRSPRPRPSTTPGAGVKWKARSGRDLSHSWTSADLWEDTLSRMTCTGVPGPVPSATWPGKAVNSADRCRSTVCPTTLPVATAGPPAGRWCRCACSRASWSPHAPASSGGVAGSAQVPESASFRQPTARRHGPAGRHTGPRRRGP